LREEDTELVKIDLITGFLGAGKTTFLKKYAQYLLAKGQNIGILENDFGAVNVDMMLLQDLMGDNCELEMVSGGCDADCHRRRFKTKLIAMGMCGYDRVIVEPSGIFDVDEFFDALREEPLDRWYEVGNVITIVDANLEENLSEEAEYILASEVANAGQIVLSHADEVTEKQADAVVAHLNRALEQIKCPRRVDKEVLRKSTLALTEQDFDKLVQCGYELQSYRKIDMEQKKSFESVYFMNVQLTEEQLKSAVEKVMNDPECGEVFRVKGFLQKKDGGWIQLNATHNGITMNPIEKGQEVIIVIGENLQEEKINNIFSL
jgi:G3E family GTPase